MIQFVNAAEKLISTKSLVVNGNDEISQLAASLMRQVGMKAQIQSITHAFDEISKKQHNVIGILGDPLVDSRTKKGLMFVSHLDTTNPGLSRHWDHCGGDPYKATFSEERVYGLGVASGKLDFLCKLMAIDQFKDRTFREPLYLVATGGEEWGHLGARFLVKSMVLNPRYVVVGEPTGLVPQRYYRTSALYCISTSYNLLDRDAKGFNTRIEIRAFGRGAHSDCPQKGVNAITKIIEVIEKIQAANFQIRLNRLEGGDSFSRVADDARVEFFIQNSSFEDFKRFYRDQLGDSQSEPYASLYIEFGGLGESGVRFLPETLVKAVVEIQNAMSRMVHSDEKGGPEPRFESGDPATSTFNLCKVVPRASSLDLFFDVSLLPQLSAEGFDRRLREEVSMLNLQYPQLGFRVTRPRLSLAPTGNVEGTLFTECQKAQAGMSLADSTSHSRNNESCEFLAAGYETVAVGPGHGLGNIHSPDEGIEVDQLDHAIHYYARLIERFCL